MSFFRSPMFPIFMTVFVDALGFGVTMPILPLYAQGEFGASAIQIAAISSFYFIAQLFAAPQVGRWSDRWGRRPMLMLSQCITIISFLLSGFAPALPFLFLARTVAGLAGGSGSVSQAYLSDVTDPKNRASGLGVINAGYSSGFIFGPAFGSFIASLYGARVPFFVGACFAILSLVLSYFMLPESLTPERRKNDAALKAKLPPMGRLDMLRSPSVLLIMLIAFGGQFAFFNFQSMYVLWAERIMLAEFSPQTRQQIIGGTFTLLGIFGIFTQIFLVGRLARRIGEKAMIVSGNLMRFGAWLTLATFPFLNVALWVLPIFSVGSGIFQPALTALLTYATPPGRRGQAIGLLEGAQSIGRIGGPLVAGLLFERINPSAPMVTAALSSLVFALIALGLWRVSVGKTVVAQGS